VNWPTYPQRAAIPLPAPDRADRYSLALLSQWCTDQASVSPARRDGIANERHAAGE